MQRHVVTLVAIVVLLWAAGVSVHPAAASSGEPEMSQWTEYRERIIPSESPIDEAVDSGMNRTQLDTIAQVVDANPNDFLGYWWTGETLAVLPASKHGTELAKQWQSVAKGLEIRESTLSATESHEVGDDLRSASPDLAHVITTWGPSPEVGGIFVWHEGEVSEAHRSAIDAFAKSRELPILIERVPKIDYNSTVDRQTDYSLYAGGARYGQSFATSGAPSVSRRCSTGFGWEIGSTRYVLTAGHCFPRGTTFDRMWAITGANSSSPWSGVEYGGVKAKSTWKDGVGSVKIDGGYYGDLALVNVKSAGNNVEPKIWWGSASTTTRIPATGRNASKVGDHTCYSGATSGSDCWGVISATGVSHAYTGGDVIRNADMSYSYTDSCPDPGDSGGSVIIDHDGAETRAVAVGIVSGTLHYSMSNACEMWFTSIGKSNGAWGGTLVTN